MHAHCITSPSSLIFSIFFLIFFLFFLLCFSVPFSRHGKGLFIVPAVTNVLPFCLLTAFVWSGCTCRLPGLWDIHPRQTEVGLFCSSIYRNISSYHDINAFSLYSQSMHPMVLPQTCLFWVVYHSSRTYLPKEAWTGAANRSFPSPHHQTIPPLPLISGPWPHHVLYWLGTGWWCLGVACASLSNLSKSLPATHASAAT